MNTQMKPNVICAKHREFCEIAGQCKVIFYYVGYFSQNIISAMAEAITMGVEHIGAASPTRRKLFSSFIEMAQNIIHYSAASLTSDELVDNEMRHGSVCICKEGDKYCVVCSNPIRSDVADRLREKLESLSTMTTDEIKAAYKKVLRGDSPQDSKGAGLGLLTMARDASQPLEYEFSPSNDPGITMFYLKIAI